MAQSSAGDSVNKKGAITGGYVDRKSSRLQTQANIKEAREQYETQNKRHAKLKAEAESKRGRGGLEGVWRGEVAQCSEERAGGTLRAFAYWWC